MTLHLMENTVYEYSSKVFKQTHILSNFDFLITSWIFPKAYVLL